MIREANRVLKKLSDSRDRVTLRRRLNIYRINFRADKPMQRYLDRIERLIEIRR